MKVLAFCLRFQVKKCVLRVNKSNITDENAINGNVIENEDNYESSKDKKT